MKKYGVREENMKKRNKGITLMTLVITVIVLLILATITISAISGNNIITNTINAKENAEIEDEIKLVGIAVNQAKNVNKYGDLKEEALYDAINASIGRGKTEVQYYKSQRMYSITFKSSKRSYQIYENGYAKYIGKIDDAIMISADPTRNLSLNEEYEVNVTIESFVPKNIDGITEIKYKWDKSEDKPEEYKEKIDLKNGDSDVEKVTINPITLEKNNTTSDGLYYLHIEVTKEDGEKVEETFGPYALGVGKVQLAVDPNGGTWENSREVTKINGNKYDDPREIPNPEPQKFTISFDTKDQQISIPPETLNVFFTKWNKKGQGTLENVNGKDFYRFGDGSGTITAQYTVDKIILPEATKEGYILTGWSNGKDTIAPGNEYTPTYKLDKDKNAGETLTAVWSKQNYTATFNGNGGSNGTSITKFYGDALGELPTSTRNGYTFDGWYTEKNGGTKISKDTTMPGRNVEYYAHWSTVNYTITYDLNGGKLTTKPENYTVESNDFTLPQPTKEGYTFTGWTGSNGTTPEKEVTIEKGTTGDKNYTANYADDIKPAKPTVVANYNSGNATYTSGTWANKQVYTTITSTDAGSGIKEIQYSKDNGKTWTKLNLAKSGGIKQNGTSYYGQENWSATNGRDITILFRVIDDAGNISDASEPFNIKYDTAKPTITADNIEYGETLSIRLQDALSGVVAWQVNESTTEPTTGWTTITSTKDTTVTKTGLAKKTYYIWAKDEAGNVISKEITVTGKMIAIPTASNKTYTGVKQTGVAGGTEYTVTDGEKIDAGTYTAKAVLTDKTNTTWSDGTTADKNIEWTIAQKEITVKWGTTTSWVYDGNSHAPTVTTPVNGVNSEKINLKVEGQKINVGTDYTATASMVSVENGQKKIANYKLKGDTKKFSITNATITGTLKITGTNTYGSKLTANISGLNPSDAGLTYQWYSNDNNSTTGGTAISGATSKDYTVGKGLVGKYIYVVVTATKENYADKEFTDITDSGNNTTETVSAKKITAPTASNKTYSGVEQTGVATKSGYNVTDGAKIDAGNYTAKAVLEDKDNTVWGDGTTADKSINWTISKKQVAVEWNTTSSFTYNGNNQGPTLKNTQVDGVNNEKINLEVTGQKKDVGTNYTATAKISSVTGGRANKDNYELTGNTKIFAITAKDISKTTSNITGSLSETVYTYDGTEKKPTETVKDGETKLTKGTDYTVTYQDNINAGTGKVVITGKGNYTGTITLEFTINKKKITIPTVSNKTYNTKQQSISAGSGYTLTGTTKATNVSTNTATAKLTDTSNTEWSDSTSTDKTITWKIVAYNLSNSTIETVGTQEFTGSAITPEPGVTVPIPSGSTTTLVKGTDFTYSYKNNTAKGTATVTITGKGNYTGTKSGTFEIAPTLVKVTSSDYNKVYDGSNHGISLKVTEPTSGCTVYYKEGTTALTKDNYTTGSTTKIEKKNAGTYTIQWYVHTTDNNYSDRSGSNKIIITKKQSTTSVEISGTNTYGSKLTANVTTDGDGDIEYQWYKDSISDANKISGAINKDYTIGKGLVGKKIFVVATVKDGTNYKGSNANDVTDATKNGTETVAKATPVITLSATSGTVKYNGTNKFTATVKATPDAAGTLKVTSGTAANVSITAGATTSVTATSAGKGTEITYKGLKGTGSSVLKVEFIPTDTDNFNSATSKNYTATLEKIDATTSVKITGTNTQGQKLTAVPTTNGDGTKKYQWFSNTTNSTTGGTKLTESTTSAEYTVGTGLVGKYIYVVLTVEAGTNYKSSNASDITDDGNNSTAKSAYVVTYEKGANVTAIGATTAKTTTGKVTLPSITAAEGYTASGWYNGNTKVGNAGAEVTITGNATLTAKAEDKTAPTITVSPTSATTCKTKDVTITASDNESGLSNDNSYQYYLSSSETALSDGSWTNYTSGTAFTIGSGITGTRYLFVKRVTDNAGNTSTTSGTATTISGTTYQRFGSYVFDNKAPNVVITGQATSVTDGLIRYYDGANNLGNGHTDSPTIWKDLSDNNDGTVNGPIGNANGYAKFDGIDDYVLCGTLSGITNVTAQADVYFNSIPASGNVCILGNWEGAGFGLYLNNGRPAFQIYDASTSSWKSAILDDKLVTGRKYTMAGTFDGTKVRLYVDGVEQATVAASTMKDTTTQLAMGGNPSGNKVTEGFTSMNLYTARVYNRALSQAEIKQNMNADRIKQESGGSIYDNSVTLSIIFNEDVTGFTTDDITVSYGTKGELTKVSDNEYTLPITGITNSKTLVVSIAASSYTDLAGNNGTAYTIKRYHDVSGSTVTITADTDDITTASSITYTISVSEPVVGLLASDITVTNGIKGTFTKESEKLYKLVVTNTGTCSQTVTVPAKSANDMAGNLSKKGTKTIKIDRTAPTITVSPESATACKTKDVTITVADTGGAELSESNSYQYYLSSSSTALSGGSWTDYTSGTPFTIGEGITGTRYLFVRRVQDSLGNISTTEGTAQVVSGTTYQRFGDYVFDNTAPEVTISRTDFNTFSWNASDNTAVKGYAITKTNTQPTTWTTTGTLTSGTKDITDAGTYYVWAKDEAGNVGSKSITAYAVTTTIAPGTSLTVKEGSTTITNKTETKNILKGTVLTITGSANTGYGSFALKVNNTAFTSGNTHTVSGTTTIATSASPKTLEISLNNNSATTTGTTKLYEVYANGVYTDSTKTKAMTASANPISLPAKVFKITYNYNEATSGNSTTSENATFTFGGYYKEAGLSTEMIKNTGYINTTNFKNTTYTTAGTLYAKWTGGSVTLPTPTKTGYTFGGWYSDSGLTTSVGAGGASYTPSSNNVTLYAKWTINKYTITFAPNGGTMNSSTSTTSYNQNYGTTITMNNPTRTGYEFIGWSSDKKDNVTTAGYWTYSDSKDPLTGNTLEYIHSTDHRFNGYAGGTAFSTTPTTISGSYTPSSYASATTSTVNYTTSDPNPLNGISSTSFYRLTRTSYKNAAYSNGPHGLLVPYLNPDTTIVFVVVARFPVGWTFNVTGNSGGKFEYLSSRAGTGKWATYVVAAKSDISGGVLMNAGHMYITNSNSSTNTTHPTMDVAYEQAYYTSRQSDTAGVNKFKIGATNETLTAVWRAVDQTVKITPNSANGNYKVTATNLFDKTDMLTPNTKIVSRTSPVWNGASYLASDSTHTVSGWIRVVPRATYKITGATEAGLVEWSTGTKSKTSYFYGAATQATSYTNNTTFQAPTSYTNTSGNTVATTYAYLRFHFKTSDINNIKLEMTDSNSYTTEQTLYFPNNASIAVVATPNTGYTTAISKSSGLGTLTTSKTGDITTGTLANVAGNSTTTNLTVNFTGKTYTVSFNNNNGTGGQSSNVTATYGSAMPSISTTAPIRTGYTFQGWYDNATYTSGTQYYTAAGASSRNWDKTSNTTLYAGWKANELTFGNQTITKTYSTSSQTGNVTAATNGTGSYTYTKKSGESDITVSEDGVITIPASKTAGTYTIVITAKDNESLKTKDATYTIKINKGTQTMTASKKSDAYTQVAKSLTDLITTSNVSESAEISYSIKTDNTTGKGAEATKSKIASGKLTAGTMSDVDDTNQSVVITVTAAATTNYNAKSVDVTIPVKKNTRTLSFTSPTNTTLAYKNTATVTATASGSGGTPGSITYSSETAANVSISGTTITAEKSSGSSVITATMARTTTVAQATKTITITTAKATPVLTLSSTSGNVTVNKETSVTATTKSGSPASAAGKITMTTIDGITYTAGNNASITATTAGVNTTLKIKPTKVAVASKTITVTFTPTDTTNFNTVTAKYTIGTVSKGTGIASVTMAGWTYGGTASNPVPTSSTNGTSNVTYKYKVSTAADSTYTTTKPSSAGTYTVQATFAATSDYNAVTATANFTIAKKKLSKPTVSVSTAGIVTWGNVADASGYEISLSASSGFTTATSGIDYLSNIIASTGSRTVYVRATNTDTTNYTTSDNGTKAVNVYKVTFASNNTNYGTVDTASYNVISGTTISVSSNKLILNGVTTGTTTKELNTVTATNKTGYSFSSWSKTSGSIIEDTTIKATFKVKSYKITLKAGNGISKVALSGWTNTGTATMTKNLEYGSKLDLSTVTPTFKDGYSGSVWTKTSGSGTLSGTTFTVGAGVATLTVAATTLAAPVPSISTTNTTKVYGASATTLTATQTTTYDTGVSVYYKFGNSTSASGTYTYGTASTTTTSSVSATSHYGTKYYKVQAYATDGTLTSTTATWSSSMYVKLTAATITFNKNNGTLSGTSPLYAKKDATTLYTTNTGTTAATAPTATRTGYTFTGWYTAASDGSKILNADGSFTGTAVSGYKTATAWATTANKTLYAHWEKARAIFKTGKEVNIKMKQLAGNSNVKYNTNDTKITSFKRASSIENQYKTDNNIVSTEDSNTPIYIWYDNGIIYYYTEVENPETNIDSSFMFAYLRKATDIEIEKFDTRNTTSMNYMFHSCEALTSLDVSGFDTSKVTNMSSMFDMGYLSTSKLTSIDVSGFNTSKVTNMSRMFGGCEALTSLDVSGFNTSQVKDMSSMFYFCEALTSIDVSGFNTSNVTNMSGMFDYCEKLTNLDVSGFNTSKVTNMSSMFYSCEALTSLDVSGFDTSNVTNMSSMFDMGYLTTSKLTSIDVSGFNTSKVTNMSSMFKNCKALTSIDVSGFNTSNVTDMTSMFQYCKLLTSIDVSGFNTLKVTNMSDMFNNCQALTSIDVSGFNTSNVTDMSGMFSSCDELTNLDVSGFNTSNVTDMSEMFRSCNELTNLDVSGFDTSKVTNMRDMFSFCWALTSIDVSGFNTSNVTDMTSMFHYCRLLTSIDVSGFNTLKVTNMSDMFNNCQALTSIDVSGFNTSQVTNMSDMFNYCEKLTNLDVSGFNTSNVTDMSGMFQYCSITSIDVSRFNTTKVTDMSSMFEGCDDLTSLDLSSFDTSNVKDMSEMFSYVYRILILKKGIVTIYVSDRWNTNAVTKSSDMFKGVVNLVGGNGTTYDSNKVDKEYARIDQGTTSPGYFTYKAASTTNLINSFSTNSLKLNNTTSILPKYGSVLAEKLNITND